MNDITKQMDEAEKILAEASGKHPRIEVRSDKKQEVTVERTSPEGVEHRAL